MVARLESRRLPQIEQVVLDILENRACFFGIGSQAARRSRIQLVDLAKGA